MDKLNLPNGWEYKKFVSVLRDVTRLSGKVKKRDYKDSGKYRIVDQGQRDIAGYSNDATKLFSGSLPIILFGDHTCALKFIDFPFITGADGTKLLKTIEPHYNPRFVYFYLRSLNMKPQSYRRHFSILRENAIPIPFPEDHIRSMAEQRRIVARIEALFRELEEMRRLQVRIVKDTDRLMDAILAEVFRSLPSYTTKTIDEIAFVKGGKRLPKGANYADSKTAYPYLRVTDFNNFSIYDKDIQYLPPSIFQKINRYTISSDDVYISIAGTVGRVGTVPEHLSGANLTENAAKIVFRPDYKEAYDNEFLVYYLASPEGKKQINDRIKSAGQPKLALKRIKTIKIPYVHDIQIQKRLVAYINSTKQEIWEMKNTQSKNRKFMDDLEQSILTQAFTGEL